MKIVERHIRGFEKFRCLTLVTSLQETQELQRKQSWYQQNQVSMTKEDEEEYLNYCSEAMFRIHILEQRLNRYYSAQNATTTKIHWYL